MVFPRRDWGETEVESGSDWCYWDIRHMAGYTFSKNPEHDLEMLRILSFYGKRKVIYRVNVHQWMLLGGRKRVHRAWVL